MLKEQITHFGWDVGGKCFLLLGVHISKSVEYDNKFQGGDEQLATFAASNIIGDIAAEHIMNAQVINLQNMMIGCILSHFYIRLMFCP